MKRNENFIKNIIDCLIERWGEIQPEWQDQLQILNSQYDLYLKSLDDIDRLGMTITARNGAISLNPAVKAQNQSFNAILKLLHEFGLTPISMSKAKRPKDEGEDKEKDNDIIRQLIS